MTNLSARPRLARRAWIVAALVLALVQGALLATTGAGTGGRLWGGSG